MSAAPRAGIKTLLGCRHPIVLAGMGGVARADLVAAVSAAGGFGFLGMVREPVGLIEREVARVRDAGIENFGVNIIPAATQRTLLDAQIDAILALGIPAVELFWDIDPGVVRRFRNAGVTVVYQVGSVEEAEDAEKAGAQAIVAQGMEAGGHVRGRTQLRRLLPAVVDAVEVPVLAAGGLASGADLAIAQALGADGVVLGTALIAAEEAFAHPHHQKRLVGASAEDTMLTDIFHINWPEGAAVRVLTSAVTAGERGSAKEDTTVAIGEEEGRPIYLFSTDSPLRSMSGDFEAMALYAGTGVGQVAAIRPAAAIIDTILGEARALGGKGGLEFLGRASSVCYADEVGGAYMGFLDDAAAAAETDAVLAALRALLVEMLAGRRDEASRPPFVGVDLDLVRDIARLTPHGTGAARRRQGDMVGKDGHEAALERLHGLIPRLPEGERRRALLDACKRLEAQEAALPA